LTSSISLRASGLYTSPNILSAPEGSLQEANNVILRRDGIIESRRGYKRFNTPTSNVTETDVKQLMEYKGRILRHAGTQLQWADDNNTFKKFIGDYSEQHDGQRLKYKEVGGTIYFTSDKGIRKLSLKDKTSFNDDTRITKAGLPKSIEPELNVRYLTNDLAGIMPRDSAYSYRAVWCYNDENDRLVIGAPSQKVNIYNQYTYNLYQDYMRMIYSYNLIIPASNNIFSHTGMGDYSISNVDKLDVFFSQFKLFSTYCDESIIYGRTTTGRGFDLTGHTTTVIDISNKKYIKLVKTSFDYSPYLKVGKHVKLSGFPTLTGTSGAILDINVAGTVYSVRTGEVLISTDLTEASSGSPPALVANVNTIIYSNDFRYLIPIFEATSLISPSSTVYKTLYVYLEATIALLKSNFYPISYITEVSYKNNIETMATTAFNTLTVKIVIPSEIREWNYNVNLTNPYDNNPCFLQVYRSAAYTNISDKLDAITPPDELFLSYEIYPSQDQYTQGYIEYVDKTPDNRLGAYLYTNQYSGQTIAQQNNRPPYASDINTFSGYTFYSNTISSDYLEWNLLSVYHILAAIDTLPNLIIGNQSYKLVKSTNTSMTIQSSLTTFPNTIYNGYIDIKGISNTYRLQLLGPTDSLIINKGYYDIPVLITSLAVNDVLTAIKSALDSLFNDFNNSQIATSVGTTELTTYSNKSGKITNPILLSTSLQSKMSVVSVDGISNNPLTRTIAVSIDDSPANAIDETAKNIVKMVNGDLSNIVNITLVSQYLDQPGLMYLESREVGVDFTVGFVTPTSNDLVNDSFLPSLATTLTSNNQINPNYLYYSKLNAPDAVPAVNYIPIGNKDNPIIRIFPLRNSLFIFKKEGVYRLSGTSSSNFNISLFDSSSDLVGIDSLTVVNNMLFGWTTQGIAIFNESGSKIISKTIDDLILPLYPRYISDFKKNTVGIGYESDNSYMVFTKNIDGNIIGFRYSTITDSWTNFIIPATCAILYSVNDLMVLGINDRVLIERKAYNRYDYADEELTLSLLGANVPSPCCVYLGSDFELIDPKVGDILYQYQDVSNTQFNDLLLQLDGSDSFTYSNYNSYTVTYGNTLLDNIKSLANVINMNEGSSIVISNIFKYQDLIDQLRILFPNDIYADGLPVELEILVSEIDVNGDLFHLENDVQLQASTPTKLVKAIVCGYRYSPLSFNDPLRLKHLRECTVMLEKRNLSKVTLSFATDLIPETTDVEFILNKTGQFGSNLFGAGLFGGSSNSAPLRTFIPRYAQRCRYLSLAFGHVAANESWGVLGITLTGEFNSIKAYR
jgi:hypothetical protein